MILSLLSLIIHSVFGAMWTSAPSKTNCGTYCRLLHISSSWTGPSYTPGVCQDSQPAPDPIVVRWSWWGTFYGSAVLLWTYGQYPWRTLVDNCFKAVCSPLNFLHFSQQTSWTQGPKEQVGGAVKQRALTGTDQMAAPWQVWCGIKDWIGQRPTNNLM